MLKIAILYGAVRNGRLSIRIAKAVQKAIEDTGKAEISFIDIKDWGLPVMEERLKDMKIPDPKVARLGEIINQSDGVILISPEYNNSYSGALKNVVDYFTKEWYHKPMGVVAASSGEQGGINASNLMQLLILAINGFAMPTKLLVPQLEKNLSENGDILSEPIQKKVEKFVKEMLWFSKAIMSAKKNDSGNYT